jgi:hypothetical protein
LAILLTDAEIEALVNERKPLPEDYRERVQAKPKQGHKERELDVAGVNGSEFRLILRHSLINSLDFSIILAFRPPRSTQLFRLRRYNGKSHEHTNVLERQTFYGFHIHKATERYEVDSGFREDGFAELTDRYSDFQTAFLCMIKDCGFEAPEEQQRELFETI